MSWIKNVLLDIIIVIVALVAAVFGQTWAWWIIAVYTPLMLVLKIVAFAAGGTLGQMQSRAVQPPTLFFHVVYAAMTGIMILGGWWILALGWLVIWGLSVAAERRRIRPVARASATRR